MHARKHTYIHAYIHTYLHTYLHTDKHTLHIHVHRFIPRDAVAVALAGDPLQSDIPPTTSVGASGWLLMGLPTIIN